MADPATDRESPFGSGARNVTDNVTVFLRDIHVYYRVYQDLQPRLRDVFRGRMERRYREIKAVRGVTLTSHAGEAIGLVGRNGSGKSTLLQALAGLLPVTVGEVYASSQPSLLGVGAALQPNLSGKRNVELGLLALGHSGREASGRIDDILAFAGLRQFGDLPIKTYSSGMRARLHFSIATAVEPEVLLVDEALAVGDGAFKRRSERRIGELLDAAGTVFLVSHALGAVRGICTRTIWIDQGQVVEDGPTHDVLAAYERFLDEQTD